MSYELDRERREFIKKLVFYGGATFLTKFFPSVFSCAKNGGGGSLRVSREIFPLSVSCGDVSQSSAWLWTYVESQENKEQIPLIVELSENKSFESPLREVVLAKKEDNFTVRIKIDNLTSGKRYFYRFIKDDVASPVGEFKTLEKNPERLRFAFVSCQDYTNGFYSAYYHLAQEELDFVVHLGDYIYEMVRERFFQDAQVRSIIIPTDPERIYAYYLQDYRKLYYVYKSDPYLQMAHEKFPFYIVWDDHEFANDCAGYISPDNGHEIAGFYEQPERRSWANRAFWEHIPGDFFWNPVEPDPIKQIRVYRSFRMGTLAHMIITDERLYRSKHICGEGRGYRYATSYSRDRCNSPEKQTMLGDEQFSWFISELKRAHDDGVIWKIHCNEVYMMQMKLNEGISLEDTVFFLFDQWDGYPYERWKILNFINNNGIKNYFVITGDLHVFAAGELYENFFYPTDSPRGVEFIVTSITSLSPTGILRNSLGFRDEDVKAFEKNVLERNRHIKFFESSSYGYAICELTPQEAIVEFWKVSSINEPPERTEKILLKKWRVSRDSNKIEDITYAGRV